MVTLSLLAALSFADSERPVGASPAQAPSAWVTYAASAGLTLVSAPVTWTFARAVGTSSSNLFVSGVPALLLAATLQPLLTTAFVSHFDRAHRPKFWPMFALTAGTQVAVLVSFIAAGGTVKRVGDLMAVSLVDAATLPAAATLSSRVWNDAPGSAAGAGFVPPLPMLPSLRGTF
jgi:hypothetical protein